MREVKWRTPGLFKADAGKVREEITQLSDRKDFEGVKPQEIVQYAELNPSSELHKCFEWDDSKAANLWRVKQAGDIIRNIVVYVEDNEEGILVPIRPIMYSAETNTYKPIVHMIPSEYETTVKEAWEYFRRGKEKYKFLEDAGLQAVMAMID